MSNRTHLKRMTTALALTAGTLLALPASGMAADTFGSRLLNEPANASECPGTCTLVSYIHPSDPNGDPYAGGSPVDGVITKFKVRAKPYLDGSPVRVTPRVADITRQNPDTATARATASGPQVTLTADAAIEQHATRVPVSRGQHLALDGQNAQLTYNAGGDKFSYVFTPPLGSQQRTSNQPTGELLVQATVEPDRDRDGYGDETQDQKPRVSSLKLRKDKVSLRLNQAARVRLTVQKRRTAGGRTRYVTVKRMSLAGRKGANSRSFAKRLSAGRYRVTAVATDAAGNKSRPHAKRFRIKQ